MPAASLAASVFSPGALNQRRRLLRLAVHGPTLQATPPSGRAYPVTLVIERLVAREALGEDFDHELTLLADSAHIALKDMMGRLVTVSLVRADGSLRHFGGHVFEFALTGSDGGIATYRARLRPWSQYLALRVNNRLFMGQSLREQTDTLLQEHQAQLPSLRWDWRVQGADHPMTMAVQGAGIGESDLNYLRRHWEEAGWLSFWEHSQEAHTLVVADSSYDHCRPIDGNPSTIRFQREGGSQDEDSIATWTGRRELASGQHAQSAFDFKNPRPRHNTTPTLNRQGEVATQEVHEYTGHYGFTQHDASGDKLGRVRMQEIEAKAKVFEASGNCRRVQPGRWFTLSGHFSSDADGVRTEDKQYLILSATHEASNNFLMGEGAKSTYTNTFTASRRSVPWHPGRGRASEPVRVNVPQTATVVGQEGLGALDVDEHGRILVQFHWDREGKYSARVRVATNWAGGETGALSLPRVGSEVLIAHLDGNPDHPIVTGVVYNAQRMPPWQLPQQKALTGLRSRELNGDAGNSPGGRSNHLILDDTAGSIQAQLKSDHQSSSLSLGHITRIEDTQGRKDGRGQGFELRTDGHGALRAQDGLLITTEARPNAQAHSTDMGETVARLTAARDQHEGLSDAATQAKAQDAGDQNEVAKALKEQNDALKGSGGDKSRNQHPEYKEPHLTTASPVGIQSTTAGSTHHASNEHHAITSGAHTSVSAGKSFLASAKEAIKLFAYRAGMRLIAANSDIDIQALKQNIRVLAKLDITQQAENVTITAQNQVVVNGGGSYSKWQDGSIVHGTPGLWREHAARHSMTGPDSRPVPAPEVASALASKPDRPVPVVDALGNTTVPDSKLIARPGQQETRTQLNGGKLDPGPVLNHHVIRRWRRQED